MAGLRKTRIDRSRARLSADSIFVGAVALQEIVNDSQAELLRVTAVTFENGARNRPHRHGADQVLVAVDGAGFVATADEEMALDPGDVALIPANTRHWHGARPGESFTHLAILTPGHMEIDDEPPQ
jgi:quercetin dioxygenase-like cupin family protein